MKKFLLFLSVFLLIGVVVPQANALLSLSIDAGDPYYVGHIVDGIPSNLSDEVGYINDLITLAANAGATNIGTETYDRLGSSVTGLTPAELAYAVKDESGSNQINATGFEYVLGKYDASNPGAGSYVWFMAGGFSDTIVIPSDSPAVTGSAPNGYGLSHISLFNPGNGAIPEPATIMLVGIGLLGAGFIGRKKFGK